MIENILHIVLYSLGLFLTGCITDIIWALYIRNVSENDKLKAAIYSVGTGICTIIFVEGILHGIFYSIFWLIGLFIGTYYSNSIEIFMEKIWVKKLKKWC